MYIHEYVYPASQQGDLEGLILQAFSGALTAGTWFTKNESLFPKLCVGILFVFVIYIILREKSTKLMAYFRKDSFKRFLLIVNGT